ncbi:Uncharacterised protein [Sphingobacterium mizutaii]|uniref:Uncharacterized protein n=1 Tax=Sphingobacterium mizutaii TaxID=1010 RepID=A0AAJ4XC07_9SPHI|nr:hypothetical protein SAMN05192578_101534 [Sphingobacterium mizutaii]SNV48943.1 Uncharacterised protein [Sphingobacterium mizutaii]
MIYYSRQQSHSYKIKKEICGNPSHHLLLEKYVKEISYPIYGPYNLQITK